MQCHAHAAPVSFTDLVVLVANYQGHGTARQGRKGLYFMNENSIEKAKW
jgi:hypothetical protein